MSETCATTVMNPVDANIFGSIGMPVPQTDIRIADVNDLSRDVEIGEEGELWVRSDSCGVGAGTTGGHCGDVPPGWLSSYRGHSEDG